MPSTILNWISSRTRRKRNAHDFYGSIVAAARNPALYSELGVPDTLEGRFEMLVLHMFVFLERLNNQNGDDHHEFKQELVDLFFADMDATTRQAGVGDMAVPKKMRELGRVFAERMETYQAAFAASGEDVLARELENVIFTKTPHSGKCAEKLGTYLKQLRFTVQHMAISDLKKGGLEQITPGKGEPT